MMRRYSGFLCSVAFATAALTLLGAVGATFADDHDFEDFARRDGCDSVIFNDRRSECASLQRNVNRYCKEEKFDCNIGDFKSVLNEYNDVKNRSTYNDSEKKSKEERLEKLKKDLDARKSEAKRGEAIAEQCVRFRSDIFDHFKKTTDLTESAGRAQMAIREGLLRKLKEADDRRDEAKRRREAAPNDDNLKREYEKAVEEFRKIEQELGEFNKKNGKDIERNYKRLMERFEKGNEEHKTERENQRRRLNNCWEIAGTSY